MTFDQAESVLTRIEYRKMKLGLIRNWSGAEDCAELSLSRQCDDVVTDGTSRTTVAVRNIICLGHYLDDQQFVDMIRFYIQQFESHEADEWFKFDGKRIFDPHLNEKELDHVSQR